MAKKNHFLMTYVMSNHSIACPVCLGDGRTSKITWKLKTWGSEQSMNDLVIGTCEHCGEITASAQVRYRKND